MGHRHVLCFMLLIQLFLLTDSLKLPKFNLRKRSSKFNFLEESCSDITKTILKNESNETNFIFSPFGYSVILGILLEGADSSTREELANALHLPSDEHLVRKSFKDTLKRLQQGRKTDNTPEFQNYFYVYKNFTIKSDYSETLLENYLTEVKSVDGPEDDQNKSVAREKRHSEPSRRERVKKLRERIRRLAKRFLGIELDDGSKNEMSGFSANRLYSGTDKASSKMIIFNGLYFKGFWKMPFQYKQGLEPFYINDEDKVMTRMIYAVGRYTFAEIPSLNSAFICIPYKGERYSMLIMLPNSKNGLRELTDQLVSLNLQDIYSKLEPKHMQVSIPAFDFKTISYLKESLNELNVKTIFTKEANFSKISSDDNLFVDDIVQLVTIKVDNDAGTPNFLTASSVQTRKVAEKFTGDHPFLFFIQDHKDNLIIAAGKVYNPVDERNKDKD